MDEIKNYHALVSVTSNTDPYIGQLVKMQPKAIFTNNETELFFNMKDNTLRINQTVIDGGNEENEDAILVI